MSNTAATMAVVGFVVFFALGSAFIMTSPAAAVSNDPAVSVVAKVNSNGSGVFADRPLDIHDPAGWGGLVFMTPGPGTIQHEMLKTLVFGMGLYFQLDGPTKNDSTVYWTQIAPGEMSDHFGKGTANGGIVWEPWFSGIVERYPGIAYEVARSNMIEPGHPCCMIVVKNTFLEANEELILRFLLAYIEAVEWVNYAKAQPAGDADHELLIQIAWETAMKKNNPSPTPSASDRQAIENSLAGIDFGFELEDLKEAVADLIVRFSNSGSITKKVSDPAAYAEMLVNGTFVDTIMSDRAALEALYKNTAVAGTIRLGVLANDLHQIAVRVAWGYDIGDGMPLFEAYGLNVVKGGDFQQGGGGIMNLFAGNAIDIGVLGLPPTVIRSANGL